MGQLLEENHLQPLQLRIDLLFLNRNWKGKRWIEVVMSVLHTWRLQKKNTFQNLKLHAN